MVKAQKDQGNTEYKGGLHVLAKQEYENALELLFGTITDQNLNPIEHKKFYILAAKLMGNVACCEMKQANYERAIQVLKLAIRYDEHQSNRSRKYESRIAFCSEKLLSREEEKEEEQKHH